MASLKGWFAGCEAVVSMVVVQVISTGLQLLSRVILSQGTFIFALMAYRHAVAAVCVAPFAFYFERGNEKKLSWSVCFWLFINALTGIIMAMGLFYYGLRDTTATYATNFLNLIPTATFLLSIIARMEKLGLNKGAGRIKTVGAIICVAGALTITLYKGEAFHIGHGSIQHHVTVDTAKTHWARGTIFLVCSVMSYATWFIVQAKLSKVFPSKYWATFMTCIFATIQSTTIGICIDRRKVGWQLGWNLQLVTIVYSGVFATAASFCLISWAIANRGPSYPPMFNPLSLILVAILESLIFNEEIRVGSLLGMLMIIVGTYAFLWGRRNESGSLATPKHYLARELATKGSESSVLPTKSLGTTIAHVGVKDVADKGHGEALGP